MLCLDRQQDESVLIGETRVTVLRARGGRTKLGIEAPDSVPIIREELARAQPDTETKTLRDYLRDSRVKPGQGKRIKIG